MAGYQSKYKDRVGGKYGIESLHEMVDYHFQQLNKKIKEQSLTPELVKEQKLLKKIYKTFMKGD